MQVTLCEFLISTPGAEEGRRSNSEARVVFASFVYFTYGIRVMETTTQGKKKSKKKSCTKIRLFSEPEKKKIKKSTQVNSRSGSNNTDETYPQISARFHREVSITVQEKTPFSPPLLCACKPELSKATGGCRWGSRYRTPEYPMGAFRVWAGTEHVKVLVGYQGGEESCHGRG